MMLKKREAQYGETAPHIDRMLTALEVSRILHVHKNTVRRWSNQGILKSHRIGSRGDYRFMQEDIDDFLAQDSK
jgi:excisionase family DNA binding protein